MQSKSVSGIMLGLLLLSMLLVAFNIQPTEAQTRKVGVKIGDWAKYEATYNYTTNDPVPLFGFQPWFEDIEYFRTEVLLVTGMNITFQITIYLKNGIEMSKVMWMDISGGYIAPLPFFNEAMLFTAANLTAGDTLTPNPSSYVINATLMRTYAGAVREVNFVYRRSHLTLIRFNPKAEFLIDTTMYMFWDRATGVLVEANKTVDIANISEGYVTKIFTELVMKETNIWSPMFIPAEVCINPKSLNLRIQGKWITTYIELSEGYSINDISVSSILLNDTIPAEPKPVAIGDYDNDTVPDLMVKFDRAKVMQYIFANVNITQLLEQRFMTVTFAVTGYLNDGIPFQGNDTIRILLPNSISNGRAFRK